MLKILDNLRNLLKNHVVDRWRRRGGKKLEVDSRENIRKITAQGYNKRPSHEIILINIYKKGRKWI